MAMKPVYDLAVKTGTYTDRAGAEKGRYLNVGKVFQRDDGSLTLKLDCLPIGIPDWSGWVNCYPHKPREGATAPPAPPQDFGPNTSWGPSTHSELDDDTPF